MLKDLSPRFLEELGSPNPQPFAILEIESTGVSDEATTEAHWTANKAESNVDYDSTPLPPDSGDVILAAAAGTNTVTTKAPPTNSAVNTYDFGTYTAIDEWPIANDGDDITSSVSGAAEVGDDQTSRHSGAITNMQDIIDEIPANAHIESVRVLARSDADVGLGNNTTAGLIRVDGTAYLHATPQSTPSGYTDLYFSWTTNPDDPGVAWDLTSLAQIERVGVEQFVSCGPEPATASTNCSQNYLEVRYYDHELTGSITVELDLTGANTDNEMIVSIDDNIPTGGGLTYELFYPSGIVGYMRPTGHYDINGWTVNEADAYDGDDTDASTTTKAGGGTGIGFYIGRDNANADAWEANPGFVGTLSFKVVYSRAAGVGGDELGIEIQESDGTTVGTILLLGDGLAAKATGAIDVSAYNGDLSDLRVVVTSNGAGGTTTVDIFDCWIEGEIYTTTGVAIQDGSRVPTLGEETFRVKSTLTSDGSVTPVLKAVEIEIPDRIYKFTSRRGGIFGALPYLVGIPGRAISIDLKDFVTLGSNLTAQLQKDESVVQMLRENYFKNLHASVQIGLYRDDITEADLAYTFQGKVEGYRPGMEEVSISLKDATKDLSAKWPAGVSVTKDGIHMVDVISTVLDDVEIRTRYISRGSLDTLKATVGDGSPSSSSYVVYRGASPPIAVGTTIISEPDTAKKVVGELVELLGAFLVSQEDGRIYAIEYDSSKASIGDPWTVDDFVEDPVYNPDVENIINDTFVYFDWTGDGTDAKDFANLETSPDVTSQTNWGETNTRIIKSKWLAGSAADFYYGEELAIEIGARETERRKNGMGIFPCKTALSEFALQVGDMKDIDMSDVIINPDVGVGDTRKFMIVSKDPDWGNATISWELVEAR